MNDPRALVRSYLEAVGARDFELARSFLADNGFSYSSHHPKLSLKVCGRSTA